MRKELALSYSMISFESLDELLSTIDDYIDLHSKMAERYGDRLGYLLRRSGGSASDALQTSFQAELQEESKKPGLMGGKKDRKGEEHESGWIVIGGEEFSIRVASGVGSSASSNEVSVLFKIVEQLKARTASLKVAQKLLGDLPTQGFRADQRLLVVFKDGIPKQVIPTNEISAQQRKFRYADQFRMTILE
ncbi:MAG: hypothetical protein ACYC7D_11445 [Nitrososphaerales archaeon]